MCPLFIDLYKIVCEIYLHNTSRQFAAESDKQRIFCLEICYFVFALTSTKVVFESTVKQS